MTASTTAALLYSSTFTLYLTALLCLMLHHGHNAIRRDSVGSNRVGASRSDHEARRRRHAQRKGQQRPHCGPW